MLPTSPDSFRAWSPRPSSSSCRAVARPREPRSWRCGRGSGRRTCSSSRASSSRRSSAIRCAGSRRCVCFVAYCAVSSAVVPGQRRARPRSDDRLHPVKRARPIARGELSPRAALTIAGGLALLALLLVAPLGLAVGAARARVRGRCRPRYTLRLKHVVLLDVLAIGGAVRDPRRGGRRGGGRADLRLAAALHARCSRSSSRWRSAAASSCSSAPSARPAGRCSRATRSSSSTSSIGDRRLRDGDRVRRSTRSRPRHSRALLATVPFVVFGVFRYLLLDAPSTTSARSRSRCC